MTQNELHEQKLRKGKQWKSMSRFNFQKSRMDKGKSIYVEYSSLFVHADFVTNILFSSTYSSSFSTLLLFIVFPFETARKPQHYKNLINLYTRTFIFY